MTIVEKLEQAVLDNREGKPLDLSGELYEIFWMIYNDGVAQNYKVNITNRYTEQWYQEKEKGVKHE